MSICDASTAPKLEPVSKPRAGAQQLDVVDLTMSTERRTPPRDPDPGLEPQEPAPPADTSPDAVLRRCEQISADLRSKLGSHEGDRCATSSGTGRSQRLTVAWPGPLGQGCQGVCKGGRYAALVAACPGLAKPPGPMVKPLWDSFALTDRHKQMTESVHVAWNS